MIVLKIDRTNMVETAVVEFSKKDLWLLQHLLYNYSQSEGTSSEFEELHREIGHLYSYIKNGVIDEWSIDMLNKIQSKIKDYREKEKNNIISLK